MAASSQSVWTGSLLLLAYSIGLGVPFVLAALAFEWMTARLSFIKRHYRGIQVGAGLLLFVFGVLLMLGVLERLSRLLPAFSLGGL
jgi:cytochrome c-type biogenesis protein